MIFDEARVSFSLRLLPGAIALCAALSSCGEPDADTTGGAGSGGGQGGGGALSCPTGHIVGPDDACMPVGIQGCADLFIEEDGLCHPSMAKCPKGTIPKFDEGCVPVGIPNCAPEFLDNDGFCRPTSAKCPDGHIPIPSEGCVSIDDPKGCGTGRWGNVAQGLSTFYVDPAEPAGGDGTEEKPWNSLKSALVWTPPGGRLVLAAGEYHEEVRIFKAVEIEGRCASMVTLKGVHFSNAGDPLIVEIVGAESVGLRDLSIDAPGIGVATNSPVHISGVHIRDGEVLGILAQKPTANVTVERTIVHAMIPGAVAAAGGALQAALGAHVMVSQSVFFDNDGAGVGAIGNGTTVEVVDTVIEANGSMGAHARQGARASFRRTAVSRNHLAGVTSACDGSEDGCGSGIDVKDCLIDSTAQGASGVGVGIVADDGTAAQIERSLITGNMGIGILVNPGSSAEIHGNLVADSPYASFLAMDYGVGLFHAGASVSSSSNVFTGSKMAELALGSGASMTSTGDLFQSDLAAHAVLLGGGSLFLNSAAIVLGEAGAIAALPGHDEQGEPTVPFVLEVDGVLIEGPMDGNSVGGVIGQGPGIARIDHSLLSRLSGMAFWAHNLDVVMTGGLVTATSSLTLTVKGGTADAKYENIADGLLFTGGTQATLEGVVVDSCGRAGVLFDGSLGTVSGSRVRRNGFGLVLQNGSMVDSSASEIAGNTTEDFVSDGDLPIPDGASVAPKPPSP